MWRRLAGGDTDRTKIQLRTEDSDFQPISSSQMPQFFSVLYQAIYDAYLLVLRLGEYLRRRTVNYAVKLDSPRSGKEVRASAFPQSSQMKMVINKAQRPPLEPSVLDVCTHAPCSWQPDKGLSADRLLHLSGVRLSSGCHL